jgi:hypothetical protein
MLEKHFLPSIPEGFDVVLRRRPQVCATGGYKTSNWSAAVMNKIPLILEAIERETEPFVFSDVDIRFYAFTPADLENEMALREGRLPDIRCQDDTSSYSTGFMFIRPSAKTREVFECVLANCHAPNDDQDAFNYFAIPEMRQRNKNVEVSALPRERYWNLGYTPIWGSSDLSKAPLPANIAIHHANWVGIESKCKFLDSVYSRISKGT